LHYQYYVYEIHGDNYEVSYLSQSGEKIETTEYTFVGGKGIMGVVGETIQMAQVTEGKVTIHNSSTYDLPKAGGRGTLWYTLGGAALLIAAGALYIRSRRRGTYGDRGGAC
jgi:LPXTG-motif cell wall-anchored protein